jgi:hypothetical protein
LDKNQLFFASGKWYIKGLEVVKPLGCKKGLRVGFISGIAHHTFEIYFMSQEWSTSTFRLVPVSELASYTFLITLNL